MELSVIFITLSVLWKITHGVRCYKCSPTRSDDTNMREPLCQDFDGSEPFVTECNSSTMCHKRETTHVIENTVIKVITRGCTPQTLPGYQEKFGRGWRHVDKIHEAYDEACIDRNSEGRPTTSVFCNCRGDLCNDAFNFKSDAFCLLLALALWFVWR